MDKIPSDRASSWFLPEGGKWPEDAVEQPFIVVSSGGGDNFDVDKARGIVMDPAWDEVIEDGRWFFRRRPSD